MTPLTPEQRKLMTTLLLLGLLQRFGQDCLGLMAAIQLTEDITTDGIEQEAKWKEDANRILQLIIRMEANTPFLTEESKEHSHQMILIALAALDTID